MPPIFWSFKSQILLEHIMLELFQKRFLRSFLVHGWDWTRSWSIYNPLGYIQWYKCLSCTNKHCVFIVSRQLSWMKMSVSNMHANMVILICMRCRKMPYLDPLIFSYCLTMGATFNYMKFSDHWACAVDPEQGSFTDSFLFTLQYWGSILWDLVYLHLHAESRFKAFRSPIVLAIAW